MTIKEQIDIMDNGIKNGSAVRWPHIITLLFLLAVLEIGAAWALTTNHGHNDYILEREYTQLIERLDRMENKIDRIIAP